MRGVGLSVQRMPSSTIRSTKWRRSSNFWGAAEDSLAPMNGDSLAFEVRYILGPRWTFSPPELVAGGNRWKGDLDSTQSTPYSVGSSYPRKALGLLSNCFQEATSHTRVVMAILLVVVTYLAYLANVAGIAAAEPCISGLALTIYNDYSRGNSARLWRQQALPVDSPIQARRLTMRVSLHTGPTSPS